MPFLGIYPGEMKTHVSTKTCKLILMTALFKKAPKWKQSEHSIGEWKNKLWHIIERYSAIKRHELIIHGTTWMNLKTIC